MWNRFITEWRATPPLAYLVLILLAVPAAFYASTASMVDVWLTNETFTHGFLILPISLWLIWGERRVIARIGLETDLRALVILLPCLALWILATLIDVAVVRQLTMVAMMQLSVWLLLGHRLALALLFPLLYLFFAVPLGQSLIPPMMEFTADFTVYMVQLSGVPIFRDGLAFQLPSGNWSVVEECSGVRYLIASAALGTIYAYITYSSARKRTAFIIASLIVPIVANGLRAYGIVMIGHLSGMKYAVGADHLLYGWVFFGIVIFILFWIGGFWADSPDSRQSEFSESMPTVKPVQARAVFNIVLLATLFLALNIAVSTLKSGEVELPENAVISLPQTVNGWKKAPVKRTVPSKGRATVWSPLLSNPDLYTSVEYSDGNENVTLHLAYYHVQREGAEAISSLNGLTDPYEGDWKLTASRRTAATHGQVQESEVSLGPLKQLVWSGYLIGDRLIARASVAKFYQVKALLSGQPAATYVTLSTPFNAPLNVLHTRLDNAWSAISPALKEELLRLGEPR